MRAVSESENEPTEFFPDGIENIPGNFINYHGISGPDIRTPDMVRENDALKFQTGWYFYLKGIAFF